MTGAPGPPGAVAWITGLPSSGKSTLARRAQAVLAARGRPALRLDGDEVRAALVPPPGVDPGARDAFYETLARIAALLAGQGALVLVAATAHRAAYRERARALAPRFVEVWVAATRETCERRDPKGLWALARHGGAPGLPGAGVAYEAPAAPDVVAEGGEDDAAAERVATLLLAAADGAG